MKANVFTLILPSFVAAILCVSGCTMPLKQITGPEAMSNKVCDPLDVMLYRGSDHQFYYLDRIKFKTTYRFKVPRAQIDIPNNMQPGEFPVGMKLPGPATQKPSPPPVEP